MHERVWFEMDGAIVEIGDDMEVPTEGLSDILWPFYVKRRYTLRILR